MHNPSALNGLILVALPIRVEGAENIPYSLDFYVEGVNRIEDDAFCDVILHPCHPSFTVE